MAFIPEDELVKMDFKRLGKNVLISDKTSLYNCENISIGNNSRIDDFCVLSAGQGGIEIGDYVHIAVYSSLIGNGKITLSDFSGLSSRVSIYSSNDDYSGYALTNPTVKDKYKKILQKDVFLGKHVIVGSGTVILPGVTLEEGVSVGALSLVRTDCLEFGIYAGVPARLIKERSRDLLDLECVLRKQEENE